MSMIQNAAHSASPFSAAPPAAMSSPMYPSKLRDGLHMLLRQLASLSVRALLSSTLSLPVFGGMAVAQPAAVSHEAAGQAQSGQETTKQAPAMPALATQAPAGPVTVTDMMGRTVTLPAPAKKVVLSESRHIFTLGLLDRQPLQWITAWGDDLQRYSPATYEALRTRFPQADAIPVVGRTTGGSFSMEAVIAAKPELVIFTMYGPPPPGLERLDAAGIPYVFVDFFQKPLLKTVPSMRMLGQLLGREKEAEEFVAFYEQHMGDVATRVAKAGTRPRVLFHLNPNGKDCCFSSGPGNMSDFIAAAGGQNISENKIPGSAGKLSLEYVLAEDPDYYLAGGGSTVAPTGLRIGPGVTPELARETFDGVLQAPGISSLRAVKSGQTGGIWLFYFDNPLFFMGVEALAKMFHPEAFADVDPDKTAEETNARFLAFPLEGTFRVTAGAPGK